MSTDAPRIRKASSKLADKAGRPASASRARLSDLALVAIAAPALALTLALFIVFTLGGQVSRFAPQLAPSIAAAPSLLALPTLDPADAPRPDRPADIAAAPRHVAPPRLTLRSKALVEAPLAADPADADTLTVWRRADRTGRNAAPKSSRGAPLLKVTARMTEDAMLVAHAPPERPRPALRSSELPTRLAADGAGGPPVIDRSPDTDPLGDVLDYLFAPTDGEGADAVAETNASRRVVIRYGPGADEAALNDVKRKISAQGFGAVDLRPVIFSIRRTNVRHFFISDRAAAARLHDDALNGLLAPERARRDQIVEDFSAYRPQPEPGLLEVWLADNALR